MSAASRRHPSTCCLWHVGAANRATRQGSYAGFTKQLSGVDPNTASASATIHANLIKGELKVSSPRSFNPRVVQKCFQYFWIFWDGYHLQGKLLENAGIERCEGSSFLTVDMEKKKKKTSLCLRLVDGAGLRCFCTQRNLLILFQRHQRLTD